MSLSSCFVDHWMCWSTLLRGHSFCNVSAYFPWSDFYYWKLCQSSEPLNIQDCLLGFYGEVGKRIPELQGYFITPMWILQGCIPNQCSLQLSEGRHCDATRCSKTHGNQRMKGQDRYWCSREPPLVHSTVMKVSSDSITCLSCVCPRFSWITECVMSCFHSSPKGAWAQYFGPLRKFWNSFSQRGLQLSLGRLACASTATGHSARAIVRQSIQLGESILIMHVKFALAWWAISHQNLVVFLWLWHFQTLVLLHVRTTKHLYMVNTCCVCAPNAYMYMCALVCRLRIFSSQNRCFHWGGWRIFLGGQSCVRRPFWILIACRVQVGPGHFGQRSRGPNLFLDRRYFSSICVRNHWF